MNKSNYSLPLIILNNKQILSNCTVVPENLIQNNDSNTMNIGSNVKLNSDYAPEKNNIPFLKKNQKKKGRIRFKCLHCEYLTFRKQNLIVHLREKHETRKQLETKVNNGTSNTTRTIEVFSCTLCKMTFNTLDKCKEHMTQHLINTHKNNQNKQQEHGCKSIQLSKKKFEDIEYISKCVHCKRKFRSENSKLLHSLCHQNDCKDYKCSEKNCDFITPRWNACRIHLWKIHKIDIDMFSCQVCKKYTTTTYHNLVNHVSMKHNKTLSCVDCGAEFQDSTKLQNHRVFHSKAKPVNKERWYMEKTCVICNMVLANSKSLKLHTKNVHLKLKPYVCQVCNHGSATKYMMQVHMRQHTGEKPFNCDVPDCNFKTGDHNSLRRHKLRHSNERPYKCTHCNYKCIQVTALKSHITNNHRDKMDSSYYSCNRCTFGTVSLKRYNDHVSGHETQVQNGLEPSPVKSHETKAEMTDDDDTAQGYVDDTGGITISESVGCTVLNLDDNAIMLT
ncbi:zinc finger protein 347-like isoform X1 [Metopolophium dirhodum]|uniref:zinc finger protein 347-like isoform X1 n=2 Tax=Metopolophium dirhodum TaxID=44670 RepID=UPI00298F4450|nr:zinc finger protein 347-like isoform X1 [Metopolophium dirhodum]